MDFLAFWIPCLFASLCLLQGGGVPTSHGRDTCGGPVSLLLPLPLFLSFFLPLHCTPHTTHACLLSPSPLFACASCFQLWAFMASLTLFHTSIPGTHGGVQTLCNLACISSFSHITLPPFLAPRQASVRVREVEVSDGTDIYAIRACAFCVPGHLPDFHGALYTL